MDEHKYTSEQNLDPEKVKEQAAIYAWGMSHDDIDLSCPWCGHDLGIEQLVEYDDAISEHVVTACATWQAEQGYIKPGDPAITVESLL